MPQASADLQAEWPGMDKEAIKYLQDRGWRLNRRWQWIKPHPSHEPAEREWSAIEYLIDEWDFGGVAE